MVTPGETVSVLVKELDVQGHRISLSIRDTEGDPWLEVTDKFRVGQVVKGTLEKKETFGYFVSLAPGITGLLPKSKFSEAEKPGLIEQLNVGDSFSVTVAEIHPGDRKIVLAPGNTKDDGTWKNYSEDATPEPMSDLADKNRLLAIFRYCGLSNLCPNWLGRQYFPQFASLIQSRISHL